MTGDTYLIRWLIPLAAALVLLAQALILRYRSKAPERHLHRLYREWVSLSAPHRRYLRDLIQILEQDDARALISEHVTGIKDKRRA